MTCYGVRAWELGPRYYCPTCELDERDLTARPSPCPRCPLAEAHEEYKQNAVDEILRRYEGFPDGWPYPRLQTLHQLVSRLVKENGNRIEGGWPVTLAELARITIQERDQVRYEMEWEAWKRSQSKK